VFETQSAEENFRIQEGYSTPRWTLHTEELRHLCRSAIIVRIANSRILRWVGHVARILERRTHDTVILEGAFTSHTRPTDYMTN
jgi:hypothetical protein